MRKVLVTGAAGFLGSHVTDLLLERGYEVVGVDNLSNGNMRNLAVAQTYKGFQFYEVDVRDECGLRRLSTGVDTIIHLAAFKIPRYGGAVDTLMVNSQGTIHALTIAKELNARFVITSTSDVYGKNPKLPFSEDDDSVLGPPTVARWAYAASKLFDEHLVLATASESGLNATVLRIFGSYGPRQHLSWWGGPQSVFIDCALRGESMPIHGDGRQTRSFTFVNDTARGILLASEATHVGGELINIGGNCEITILELAEKIRSMCGEAGDESTQLQPYDSISNRKYEDVRRRVPDTEKAKRLLGFEAKYSLEEGLAETIAWQKAIRASLAAEGEPSAETGVADAVLLTQR
jgi:UDP-glucose 4-epimerase